MRAEFSPILVRILLSHASMSKGRKLAIILSIGGTIWLLAAVWKFRGLHLDRPEAALFYLLGALPALVVYGGWLLCALDRARGKAAILVWIGSIPVTIDYFILLRPFAGAAFDQPFEVLSAAWLLVATALGIQGILSSWRGPVPGARSELATSHLHVGAVS